MIAKIVAVVFAILFIFVWIISPVKTNPPVTVEIQAEQAVKNILEKSCYDCHSNKTNWPWYSHFPPGSYFVGDHVKHGRGHLNFTEWDKYDTKKRKKLLEEMIEEIEKKNMPLNPYLLLHSEAELNIKDIEILKNWVFSSIEPDSVLENQSDEEHEHNHEH